MADNYPEARNHVHEDAQRIADMGTHALIGNYQDSQKLNDELRKLETDPAYMRVLADEITKIKTTTDQLPVSAKFEKDDSGNVTSLVFSSSDELETIAYSNEDKYEECVNRHQGEVTPPQESCKELNVNATAGAIAPTFEVPVLSPQEHSTKMKLQSAIDRGDESSVRQLVRPYIGQDLFDFYRVKPERSVLAYEAGGNRQLTSLYIARPGGGNYKISQDGN